MLAAYSCRDLFEPESDATEAEKIMILSKMLQRTYYGDNSYDYGIQSLMDNNLILGHYPLHDGDYFWNNYGPLCYRQVRICKAIGSFSHILIEGAARILEP